MPVGVHELLFLLLASLFVIAALAVTRGQWKWLVGIPVCIGIAVLVTPADAGSAFVVAAPYTLGYVYLTLKRDPKRVEQSA